MRIRSNSGTVGTGRPTKQTVQIVLDAPMKATEDAKITLVHDEPLQDVSQLEYHSFTPTLDPADAKIAATRAGLAQTAAPPTADIPLSGVNASQSPVYTPTSVKGREMEDLVLVEVEQEQTQAIDTTPPPAFATGADPTPAWKSRTLIDTTQTLPHTQDPTPAPPPPPPSRVCPCLWIVIALAVIYS